MNKKYPAGLFIVGFISNIFGKFFFLFFPAVILIIIGIWIKSCFIIGLGLLALDIILSFIEQLRIKKTVHYSDDPNFAEFQAAVLSKDWQSNIKSMVEDKINENLEDDEQREI